MTGQVPVPITEAARLCEVAGLGLIGEEADEVLEHLVRMVSVHFEAPISLISLVERHRQWFCASVGMDMRETSREISFCSYAILSGESLFEVMDATLDPRFRDNALVTGEPGIRYYASMPLLTEDGLALGSLCIIDSKPRAALDPEAAQMLRHYAHMAMLRLRNIRNANYLDMPTGLFNRLRLEADIQLALPEGEHLLVVADVVRPDFLNGIVKALGYDFAQALLNATRQVLASHLPTDARLYRVSPNRFGILLFGLDARAAERLFRRLCERFDQPVVCQGIPLHLQLGIGAIALRSGQGKQDWLRLAVAAADQASEEIVRWRWYEPVLDQAQQRAFLLLAALAEAVHQPDQLHLVFQPRIDLASGDVVSMEALLRWQHPQLGWISPAEFIPLAEKTALIQPLSLWVQNHVVEQARRWQDRGEQFRLALNVSAWDLSSSAFTDALLASVGAAGLDPNLLEVEFTESALSTSPAVVRQQLQRLRDIGMEVAIDDFGTGYSNWTYLRQLPATTVKLDKSLIDGIVLEERDRRLVETLVDLAIRLGYRVVAEGVEDEAVLQAVRQLGCHEVQGYLFARPMTVAAVEQWLDQRELQPVLLA